MVIKTKKVNGIYCIPDLKIDVNQWKQLLKDKSVFDKNSLDMIKQWYFEPNYSASSKMITDKYHPDLKSTPYNGIVEGLAMRILKHIGDIKIVRYDDDSICKWIVVFDGWEENGYFIWKLKDELILAIDELKLFDDTNYFNYESYTFLEKYDYWYEANKNTLIDEEKKNKELLNEFLKEFPLEKIKFLSKEQYVIGNENKKSFCYQVENTFKDLGDIRGGRLTAFQRFGLYYDDKTNKYSFGSYKTKNTKFGNNIEDIFVNVKNAIYDLIKASKENDIDAIVNNPLNPLVKNKITYLYDSDSWIPIYGDSDLNILLIILEIPFDMKKDRVYKRIELMNFLKSLNRKDITPFRFMQFVYNNLGYKKYLRKDEYKKINEPIKIKEYQVIEVHSLKKLISNKNQKKYGLVKENPEATIQKKLSGKKGEEIVKEYIESHKKEMNINSIYYACDINDYEHYDISYETNGGETIYIEVKSTKGNNDLNINFEMSSAEFEFMKEHMNNYFIYYINNVYSGTIIKKIAAKYILEGVIPSKYKISLTESVG